MQGTVALGVAIGRAGDVSAVTVRRGVNPLLDAAAERAVRTWRFAPLGNDDSIDVSVYVNFVIVDDHDHAVHVYPPCEITVETDKPDVGPVLSSVAPTAGPR
jgi:TonB family protein